jgi:hypothetical protein
MEVRSAMSLALAALRAPRILKPEGVAPPERHSDRVIDAMLRHIANEHAGTFMRVLAVIKGDRCGNPKAQQRCVERIKRTAGGTLINIELEPGKRGNYKIKFFDWGIVDADRVNEIKAGEPLPPRLWLACNVTTLTGHRGFVRKGEAKQVLYVSRHALSRLAQRCNVRTIPEMIAAVAVLWRTYRVFNMRNNTGIRTPDGTRLAVKLANGRTAWAITKQHPEGGIIIATIIGGPGDSEPLESDVEGTEANG